jgi:flavodoxin short chain
MARILVIYGSETGNTKGAAEMIGDVLRERGLNVELRDVCDTDVSAMNEDFALYLLGVSTWGADDDEVTEDFKNFYADMVTTDFSGKRVAVFGSGDTGYENFCKAVDYVLERARERGADIVLDGLKFNLAPAASAEAIRDWALQVAAIAEK